MIADDTATPSKIFFMTFGTFLKDQVSIVSKYTGTSKFFPIFWILGPFFLLLKDRLLTFGLA